MADFRTQGYSTGAGKYRYRIEIRNAPADTARDGFGRRKGTGTTLATVWAEKQDWAGDETAEGKRETASVIVKWKIRYRTGVSSEMRILHGADVYEILSILDFDGRRRELVLTSRKVIDA